MSTSFDNYQARAKQNKKRPTLLMTSWPADASVMTKMDGGRLRTAGSDGGRAEAAEAASTGGLLKR